MRKRDQEKLEAHILWCLDHFNPDFYENAEEIVPAEFDDESDFIAPYATAARAAQREDKEWQ